MLKNCNRVLCPYIHKNSSDVDKPIVDISDEENNNNNESHEGINIYDRKNSVVTSTPKKRRITCEKCIGKSKCEYCYLDAYVEDYLSNHKN